jgi:hypothetical protein
MILGENFYTTIGPSGANAPALRLARVGGASSEEPEIPIGGMSTGQTLGRIGPRAERALALGMM